MKSQNIIEEKDLKEITKIFKTTKTYYKKGTLLSHRTNFNLNIGIILNGAIDVIKHDYNGEKVIIDKLEKNYLIGDIFSLNHTDEISLIVTSDCEILFIDFENFVDSYQSDKNINSILVYSMLKLLVQITKDKDNRVRVISKKKIRDKLLEYFYILYEKNNNIVIHIPYSYTDLSDYLVVNRSAMMRELRKMANENLITVEKKKITLNYLK